MEKNMFENKTNFYYPDSEAVDQSAPSVPVGEAVESTETTPTTSTATKKIKPKTREEHYLAKIAGEDVVTPEPKTRQEYYLKEIAENSGSGYSVEETRTVIIPEQTVTTATPGEDEPSITYYLANVTDSVIMPDEFPDTITLTADGVEYQLPKVEFSDYNIIAYGESETLGVVDWSNFPVQILIMPGYANGRIVYILTETAGTYTVKAESVTKSMTVSQEFQEAVAKSTEPLVVPMTFTNPSNPLAGGTYNSTYYDKMFDAFTEGRQIMLNVPTMGLLQIINVGSTSGDAVFNCMTMAYLSNNYLLIVINLTKEGNVSVQPFTLTRLS